MSANGMIVSLVDIRATPKPFAAARAGDPATGNALAELVRDTETPEIARATALAELSPYLSAATIDVIAQGMAAEDPAMRVAALQALESAPLNIRVRLAFPALDDPVRAVRIEAAREACCEGISIEL